MKTEQIGIRVELELKLKLEKLAESEDRTVSKYIERVLIEHINKIKEKIK